MVGHKTRFKVTKPDWCHCPEWKKTWTFFTDHEKFTLCPCCGNGLVKEAEPEEKKRVTKKKFVYRFKLKGEYNQPHWLTTIVRWGDGSIREVNYSFVSKKPWQCKKLSTAEVTRDAIDALYAEGKKPNPFELVEYRGEE